MFHHGNPVMAIPSPKSGAGYDLPKDLPSAPTTVSSKQPAPSPTSTAFPNSNRNTSPKRSQNP